MENATNLDITATARKISPRFKVNRMGTEVAEVSGYTIRLYPHGSQVTWHLYSKDFLLSTGSSPDRGRAIIGALKATTS